MKNSPELARDDLAYPGTQELEMASGDGETHLGFGCSRPSELVEDQTESVVSLRPLSLAICFVWLVCWQWLFAC